MVPSNSEQAIDIAQRVIDVVEGETGRTDITVETRIDSLGMDSLDFLEFIQCIREEIGPVTTNQMVNAETVGDIIRAVEA